MIADSYTAHPALVQVQVQVHVNVQVNVNASNPRARLPLDAVLCHLFGNRTKPALQQTHPPRQRSQRELGGHTMVWTVVLTVFCDAHWPRVRAESKPKECGG